MEDASPPHYGFVLPPPLPEDRKQMRSRPPDERQTNSDSLEQKSLRSFERRQTDSRSVEQEQRTRRSPPQSSKKRPRDSDSREEQSSRKSPERRRTNSDSVEQEPRERRSPRESNKNGPRDSDSREKSSSRKSPERRRTNSGSVEQEPRERPSPRVSKSNPDIKPRKSGEDEKTENSNKNKSDTATNKPEVLKKTEADVKPVDIKMNTDIKTTYNSPSLRYRYICYLLIAHVCVFGAHALSSWLMREKDFLKEKDKENRFGLILAWFVCLLVYLVMVTSLFCNDGIRTCFFPANFILFATTILPMSFCIGMLTFWTNFVEITIFFIVLTVACGILCVIFLLASLSQVSMDPLLKYMCVGIAVSELIFYSVYIALNKSKDGFKTSDHIGYLFTVFLALFLVAALVYDAFLAAKCREPQRDYKDVVFGVVKFYIDMFLVSLLVFWALKKLGACCIKCCKKKQSQSNRDRAKDISMHDALRASPSERV